MANELQVLQNWLGGRIEDNPLTSGATTLTSAALAAMVAIGSTQHMMVCLDPDGDDGAPEWVAVTAHTAGATTATIARGQLGTTNRAHNQDVNWRAAMPAESMGKTIDRRWGGDTLSGGPFDQEFDGEGSSLPTGWSWVNQGASTYAEEFGVGRIDAPNVAGDNLRAVVRTAPTATSWDARAAVAVNVGPSNYNQAGLVLRDSATGKLCTFASVNQGGQRAVSYWSGPTAGVSDFASEATVRITARYMRIRKNSGTSYDFGVSEDGVLWRWIGSAINITTLVTPDQIGMFVNTNNGGAAGVSLSWLRIR